MKKKEVLPKEFKKGVKQFSGEFLNGIWDGMNPGRKKGKKRRKSKP